VKCPEFLSDFNQIRSFSKDYRRSPKHCPTNSSNKSRAATYGHLDGQAWRS